MESGFFSYRQRLLLIRQEVAHCGAIGQQISPVFPHCWQAPVTHMVTRVSQHSPATHALPAQQVWPCPPQPPQLPPKHALPLVHMPSRATQVPVSQQPPALQVLPGQQAKPDGPHA